MTDVDEAPGLPASGTGLEHPWLEALARPVAGPERLVDLLMGRGLLDPVRHAGMVEAFRRVPREHFAPAGYWVRDPGGGYRPRLKAQDPYAWARPVYRDEPIVTQVDGGADPVPGARGRTPTSVLAAPSAVALLLREAAIRPGDRVLEIGAGHGFGTALCAHLAWRRVVGVEIDAQLAAAAGRNLAGWDAEVYVGDGSLGGVRQAPYDVIISTVAFPSVPQAWLEQAAPGARIVTPLYRPFHRQSVAVLTADGRGGARGRFVRAQAFVPARTVGPAARPPFAGRGRTGVSVLDPEAVLGSGDARFAVAHALPEVRYWKQAQPAEAAGGPAYVLWLAGAEGSWAAVSRRPGAARFEVEQFGSRSLWRELEEAYRGWRRLGRPSIGDWVLDAENGRRELRLER